MTSNVATIDGIRRLLHQRQVGQNPCDLASWVRVDESCEDCVGSRRGACDVGREPVEEACTNVDALLGEQHFAERGRLRRRRHAPRGPCGGLHSHDRVRVVQGGRHRGRDRWADVAVAPFRPVQQCPWL